MTYHDPEPREHVCPTPLERRAEEFAVGGMFFSPAGRWETITDWTLRRDASFKVSVRTDLTGPGYAWTFWATTRLPYLPGSRVELARRVAVYESATAMEATVTDTRSRGGFGRGHVLLAAHQVRGKGWEIRDLVGGDTVELVTVPTKARARAEVNRRAKAHAKCLGLPLYKPDEAVAQ